MSTAATEMERDEAPSGGYRWTILSLLFAATTINYFNRIVISVLIPEIRKEIAISDIAFGQLMSAFQITYTIGLLAAGGIIDRLGIKRGYLLSIVTWSVSAAAHALCGTPLCLAAWRGMLGLTASGNFPAAIKAVAAWFSARERAFATSLFNSGSSIANIVGPPVFAQVFFLAGWRWTFIGFGALGFLLAGIWMLAFREPCRCGSEHGPSAGEQGKADQSGVPCPGNPGMRTERVAQDRPGTTGATGSVAPDWRSLFNRRETWAVMLGKFFTDPVWWFYLFWMPSYLSTQRGFDLKNIALAIPLIYIVAMLLGFLGGWIPGRLMRRGWPAVRARRAVMLGCALCLPVSALAVFAHHPWTAIVLVSLACGAHNGWSANIFTLTSDFFPQNAVGSVTGIGGFAGGVGGLLLATLAPGYIITWFGYIPVFVMMGILHPLAWLSLYFLTRLRYGRP